jgi:hypothetical protein
MRDGRSEPRSSRTHVITTDGGFDRLSRFIATISLPTAINSLLSGMAGVLFPASGASLPHSSRPLQTPALCNTSTLSTCAAAAYQRIESNFSRCFNACKTITDKSIIYSTCAACFEVLADSLMRELAQCHETACGGAKKHYCGPNQSRGNLLASFCCPLGSHYVASRKTCEPGCGFVCASSLVLEPQYCKCVQRT